MPSAWKVQVRQLKIESYALYLAYCDPRTPWYARLLAGAVIVVWLAVAVWLGRLALNADTLLS